jgi:hypothetical protein
MKLLRFLATASVGIAVVVGATAMIAQFSVPVSTQVIDPGAIHADGGNSFQITSALKPEWPLYFEIRSDQIDGSLQSTLVISEDGKPLGPPHSYHIEIKEKGSGRYSHWGAATASVVIFSTSDNSDPRTNGRRYEIAARPVLFSLFSGFVMLLPFFLLALQRLLLPEVDLTIALIAGISVVALIVWISFFFDRVLISLDTQTYFRWERSVPLGYPLFLSGAKAVFGTLGWTSAIQLTFLVSACFFLARSVKDIVPARATGVAVLLLLLCYTQMFWYAGGLLSEALFIPLILLNVAAAFYLIAQRKIRYALILATSAALILFVRPAGYYIPMGIIFLLIAQRGRALWMLKWACLPFAICTVATLLINVGIRGDNAPSQMGRILFPTVSFLFEPQFVTGPYQEFVPGIEAVLRPRLDGYRKASGLTARARYSLGDYNARIHAMDAARDQRCAESGRQCSFQLKESVYLTFFVSTVLNRPLGYLKLVVEQIADAWTSYILAEYAPFRNVYLREVNDLSTRLEQIKNAGLPLTAGEVRLNPDLLDSFPGQLVELFDAGYQFIDQRWLVYLTGLVTLIAIPIAIFFRRDSVYWLALGYCGVVIHGSILLTAAVTVFLHRYATPIDPVILISGAIMIGGFASWSLSRIEQFAATIGPGLLKRIRRAPVGFQI